MQIEKIDEITYVVDSGKPHVDPVGRRRDKHGLCYTELFKTKRIVYATYVHLTLGSFVRNIVGAYAAKHGGKFRVWKESYSNADDRVFVQRLPIGTNGNECEVLHSLEEYPFHKLEVNDCLIVDAGPTGNTQGCPGYMAMQTYVGQLMRDNPDCGVEFTGKKLPDRPGKVGIWRVS